MTYFLGVDAGGSHCRARLVDATGTIVGTGLAGPANCGIGVDLLYETLMDACNQALSAAGLGAEDVAQISAGFGIAGYSRRKVIDALTMKWFPFVRLEIASDATIAHLGAFSGGDGAIVILGTGSVAYIRQSGRTFTLGGYGFPISDEGSGAGLGLAALQCAMRALDGRIALTPLTTAVLDRFDHMAAHVIGWMDHASPRDYAALAPLVTGHAHTHDPVALVIMGAAAGHIETFITAIFTRGATRCAMTGGLAPHIVPFLSLTTRAKLSAPQGDALHGALLLAGFTP